MPIYGYECRLGHYFEKLIAQVTDDPQPCPECEGNLERLNDFMAPLKFVLWPEAMAHKVLVPTQHKSESTIEHDVTKQ